jgi:hypothetical protein
MSGPSPLAVELDSLSLRMQTRHSLPLAVIALMTWGEYSACKYR